MNFLSLDEIKEIFILSKKIGSYFVFGFGGSIQIEGRSIYLSRVLFFRVSCFILFSFSIIFINVSFLIPVFFFILLIGSFFCARKLIYSTVRNDVVLLKVQSNSEYNCENLLFDKRSSSMCTLFFMIEKTPEYFLVKKLIRYDGIFSGDKIFLELGGIDFMSINLCDSDSIEKYTRTVECSS